MIGIPVPSNSSPWNASWSPSTVSMFVLEDSKISNIFLEWIMPRGLGSFNHYKSISLEWHISTFLDEWLGVVWMIWMWCFAAILGWLHTVGSSSKVDAPALQPGVPRCEVFQFFDIKKSQDMRQNGFFPNFFLIFFTIFSFTHFRKSKKAGVRINSNWFHLGSLLVGLGWRRNPRISLLSTTPRCFPADFNTHPEKVKRKRHEREVPIFVNKILFLWTQQSWRLGEVDCCP